MDATLFNIATWQFMKNLSETSPDPEIRDLAKEWLKYVPEPDLFDEKTQDVLKQWFSFADFADPTLASQVAEATGVELQGGGLDIPIDESINDGPVGDIQRKTQTASTYASPIVLDLDGDGVETAALASGAYFDHASDGFAELTGWVEGDDGLLVRDLDGNGLIGSGRELFGSETRLTDGSNAANGFEALRELDGNGDGVIDANDPAFAELRVWKDADGNGRTDAAEVLTLAEAGVQGIHAAYTNASHVDARGNTHKQVGSYTTTDGEIRAATDVWFSADATYSVPTEWVEVPEDIAVLPDAQGYGKVRDLHQAMAMDATGELKALVTAFTKAESVEDRLTLLRQIIYRWTGVQDINPTSRTNSGWGNAIGDARKLEALEEFLGKEWRQYSWGANPGGDAARTLNEAYDQLEALVYGQLMAQSRLKGLFQRISYSWDEELGEVKGNLSAVAETLITGIQAERGAGLTELRDFLNSLRGMGLLDRMEIAQFKTMLRPLGSDVVQVFDTTLAGWVPSGTSGDDGDDTLRGTEFDDVIDGKGGK